MPTLITALVGIVGLFLGWGLKTLTEAWTWRRQQRLDAYVELLEAVDRYSLPVGQLWTSGREMAERTDEWVDRAELVRQQLLAVDRSHGKLSLVAGPRGADVAFEVYFACEREYRRALAVPPSSSDHYQEASVQTIKAYSDLVDQGRREMWLQHWPERLPFRESRFAIHQRRFAELNRTDPYPTRSEPEAAKSDA